MGAIKYVSQTLILWLFVFFLGLCELAFAQKEPVMVDGPYVRYKEGQAVASTIEKHDDLLRACSRQLPLDSAAIELSVVPEENSAWGFKVRFHGGFGTDSDKGLALPSVYPPAAKLLFISDTEGEFGNLRNILLVSGVIDSAYRWTFGSGSLVVAGDLFDRGKDVVAQLWLLYKLEASAREAGGSVQLILGNHDLMNLSGDFRYTDAKYFKNAWLLGTDPAGLFGGDTELGRWLRSKHVIEKTGDALVTHGGLSPAVSALKLDVASISRLCQPYLDKKLSQMPDTVALLLGPQGLPWYRGYFRSPRVPVSVIDDLLMQYQAKYLVVGHTILRWGISGYYGGKLIGIDVDRHKGKSGAVLYAHGRWQQLDADGRLHPLKISVDDVEIREEDIL